eukprot:scaffold28399_cov124-Isochrysis_galbana.AAC.2
MHWAGGAHSKWTAEAVILLWGAATPEGVFAALTTLARSLSSGQCSGSASSAQGMARRVTRAVAQAGNHTCIELSSARSTRARFEPLPAVMSTSFSSSWSCRCAIVDLHALAEFCFC